jgi:DNA-binding PadR family transcriptional regulator
MDVRTICLGILTRGDSTGYEIRKQFEDGGYQHFVEASFGSIYPALSRLTDEGLVSVREEAQQKRPDRKVYSITQAGRTAFIGALMKRLPEDKHRSPFAFAMLFADLLPPERVRVMTDEYINRCRDKLDHIAEHDTPDAAPGERFVMGLGRAIFVAMLDYLDAHRTDMERPRAEAAE